MKPEKTTTPKDKSSDLLESFKYRGYCWAFTEPGKELDLETFLLFCKFFLCKKTHTLWKDPIWDSYTDEDLMTEYFAYLFANDEEAKKAFESQSHLGSVVHGEDIYKWLEDSVAELQRENEEKLKEMPDKVSFSPNHDDGE